MWIEQRGQQHRVYWRNQNETGPKRSFQPFPTRDHAELFRQLARTSSLSGALAWLHNPSDEVLEELLGRRPKTAPKDTSTAAQAVGQRQPVAVEGDGQHYLTAAIRGEATHVSQPPVGRRACSRCVPSLRMVSGQRALAVQL